MKVVEGVAGLRADAMHVALALERQQVLFGAGEVDRVDHARLATLLGVVAVEERDRDVKSRPQHRNGRARSRQHRVTCTQTRKHLL